MEISVQNIILKGVLDLPGKSESMVVFAHELGDGRLSDKTFRVAKDLRSAGVGTLLFDLLTEGEAKKSENRFNIEIMTERLIAVSKWCLENDKTKSLKLGYYGAGIGSTAALSSAAYWGTKIKALVSKGGRPDLAMEVLDLIEAPSLFIVGGEDKQLIDFNKQAYQKMGCVKKMEIVPVGMEKISELTIAWFAKYL